MTTVSQVAGWAADHYLVLAGAVSALLLVVVVLVTARKLPRPLEGIGAQAVVALGGVAVSVHGLWSFALDFAGLPPVLAGGFIGVFDAAELTLLVMMYRQADPDTGWTPDLRLMHRTAWLLVTFSAAMNAVHAPSWWARPVLGAVPALAAWLIELKLRAKLHTPGQDDDQDARPGPLRLVILGWQHGWAALFAVLGLDAAGRGSDIARAALAQRAARRVYRLRLALEARQAKQDTYASPRRQRRSQARVDGRRKAAQRAIDRADVATDAGQSLAMARRMAALTGVDGLARLDYADSESVMNRLESLAVVPAAEAINASSRAMQAEDARQRAEAARQEAEQCAAAARQRADADEQRAAAAREALDTADTARQEIEQRAEDARQRAEEAEQRAETARQRAERADAARQAAEQRATALGTDAQTARERLNRATEELETLVRRTDTVRASQHGTEDELAGLRRQMGDLQDARDRARSEYDSAAQAAREAKSTLGGLRRDAERLAAAVTEQQQAVQRASTARQQAEQAAREAAEQATRRRDEAAEMGALLERLRGELSEHTPDGPLPEGGRVFESDAKQAGYELFRAQTSAGRAEPRAAELAAQFGVAEGNARNWLRDFRAARARELTHPAERTARVNGTPIPA